MIRFLQYRKQRHREQGVGGCITDWWEKELDWMARAEFDGVLRRLRILPAKSWGRPDYGLLTGNKKYAGIGEVRFFSGRQYRALGFFLPDQNEETFVLLIGAYHKGPKWTPDQAREDAGTRREHVLSNHQYAGNYSLL